MLQGLLLLCCGAARGALRIRAAASAGGMVGTVLMTYALVVYPRLGAALGHTYPAAALPVTTRGTEPPRLPATGLR